MSNLSASRIPPFSSQLVGFCLRHWYLISGSFPRVLNDIFWPALDVLTWGVMGIFINTMKPDSIDLFVFGVLFYQVLMRLEMNMVSSTMEDVWAKSLLHTFMAPTSERAYMMGILLISFFRSIPGILVAALLGTLLFHPHWLHIGFSGFLLLLPPLIITGWGIGLMLSASIFRFGTAAEWLVWPLGCVLFPLYCVFYPLSIFPEPIQMLTKILPPTYVFEQMRALGAGQGMDYALLLITTLLSFVWFSLGVVCFKRGLAHMREMGTVLVMGE